MTKVCGYRNLNTLVMLLASLIFASMMVSSQCRLIPSNEEEDENNVEVKWVLEMSGRDEMVQMAGYGEEKLSTVLITGAVICNNACLASKRSNHHPLQLQLPPQPISGALVGAACHSKKKDKSPSWAKAVADEYGEFIIELPSDFHGIPDLDKACSVKVLELPKDSPCQQSASASNHKEIKLASVGNGVRTYTAGRMEFMNTMPENSEACMEMQKDEKEMSW